MSDLPPPPPPPTDDGEVGVEATLIDKLRTYQRLVEDYGSGTIDEAEFRRQAVRAGHHLEDDALWVLDVEGGAWLHYDGYRIVRVGFDGAVT